LLHLDGVASWLRVAVEHTPVRALTVDQFSRLPSRIREIRHELERLADTLMPGEPPGRPQGGRAPSTPEGPAELSRTATPGMHP
jgi:hypothetical protein